MCLLDLGIPVTDDKQKAYLSQIPLLSYHKKLIPHITDTFINISVDNDMTHEDNLTLRPRANQFATHTAWIQ